MSRLGLNRIASSDEHCDGDFAGDWATVNPEPMHWLAPTLPEPVVLSEQKAFQSAVRLWDKEWSRSEQVCLYEAVLAKLQRVEYRWNRLPSALSGIEAAIRESNGLVGTPIDREVPDSGVYQQDTWVRASRFLGEAAIWLWQTTGQVLAAPSIGPGPDGGIDLHWRLEHWEVLMTIPADTAVPAGFYGDDGHDSWVKGKIDLERRLTWLPLLLDK